MIWTHVSVITRLANPFRSEHQKKTNNKTVYVKANLNFTDNGYTCNFFVTFLQAVNKQNNRVLDARNSSLQELTFRCTLKPHVYICIC